MLLAVHALIAAHVAHWLVAGRTLSPVEPSEAMYALELGLVNAGAIFFLLAIASTLLLGRFFCGWACHVIALQDLCSWILRKLGIRLQPFRSRLLLLAPLALAIYMFAWPTFEREVLGQGPPFPGFRWHLMTGEFWRTFPGPVFAVLTLVACGFLAVVVLGNKGFCTYGCPYGALFTIADRFAPTRIVADGCKQAGRCTPACTSNVLVHQEVRTHAMVVDPGCMKCMDCVDACPNEALSVGLARPSILVGRAAGASSPQASLPLGDEILAGAVMLGATLAFRGLYDGPPLLMAVGLGAITAWIAVKLRHAIARPTARAQALTLRAGGAWTRGGRLFAVAAIAWLAFTAHSGFVQWNRVIGRRALEQTRVPREAVLAPGWSPEALGAEAREAAGAARRHFDRAWRHGLVPVTEVELGLAWTHLLRGERAEAEGLVRGVLARRPSDAELHENLIEVLLAQGRLDDAATALRAKLAACGERAEDRFRLGALLAETGRLDAAAPELEAAVRLAPTNAAARYNLGAVLRRLGRLDEARAHLREAARMAPGDPQVRAELEAAGGP